MMKNVLVLPFFLTVFSTVLFSADNIHITNTIKAPSPIGTYSQAVEANNTLFLSGQIGIDPKTNHLVSQDFKKQVHQVFKNLNEVAKASGSALNQTIKLTVYMTDLSNFNDVNTVMKMYYKAPYPARSAIEIKALPKGAAIEIEAILLKKAPMKKHSPHFLDLVMKAQKNIKEIDFKALTKKSDTDEKMILIDVRENEEWLKGHHPQAIHLSKGVIERDIEKVIPHQNTQIVLYCSGGFRSLLAAQSLKNMGYTNVTSLKGGWKK